MRGFYALFAIILILAAHVAYAEDDAAIWITSPKDGSEVLGKYADVSVSFYGGDRIDLFVDGKYTAFKGGLAGKYSYTFENVELGDIGSHTITVKLYDCANAVNGQCNFLDQDSVDVTVRYIQLSGSKTVPVGSPASYTARVCYADKVAFYVNGEKVTDKSANDEGCTSVSFSYTPQEVGSYTIRADAVKCLIGGWFCNWDSPLDSDSLTLNVTEKYSVTIQEPRTGYVIHSSPFDVGVQYSGFDGCSNPAIAIYVDDEFKTKKNLTSGSGSVLFSISVPEGEHTIKAAGYCNYPNKEDGYAGHSVTIKADYLEDIRITSPASNTTTDKSSIDVDYSYDGLGFCSSPMAYIYVNDVLKDGKSLSGYSGTGSFTVGLEKGANDIEVVLRCQKTYGAKDLVEVSDSVTVNYEPPTPPPPSNEPPKIESVDVEPSNTVEWGTFVTVTVTASDPDGVDDLDDLVVKLVDGPCDKREHYGLYIEPFTGDTASVTLRTDWTKGWQQGTRIPPGTYTLCVKAYDDSGDYDEASKTLTILEQYVPPSVSVEVPYENYRVGWAVHIEARATGTDLELLEANVYRGWDDPVFVRRLFEECSGNSCELNANFVPMIAGHYTVVARVVDSNGAEATAEDSFNVLPSPPRNQEPVAKIYTPKKASPGRTFQFTVCGSDSDGEVVTVAGKVGSGDWVYKTPNSKGCAEFSGTAPSSPTTVTVYGKAKDDDGAWSSVVSKTIEVNYSAPVVEAMNVPPKVFVGRDFNISVIVSDVDRDLDRVVLEIVKSGITVGRYSKPVDEDGGTVVFTVSVSEDGNYTAFVTAYDRQGLKASRSENFEAVFPPNEPPVVDSVEILGDVYVGEPFDMNVCAHDPDDHVQWISYRIEKGAAGASRVWADGCHVITVPSPGVSAPGEYEMNVWAVDYRNANSEIYTLTLHVVSPEHPPKIEAFDLPPDLQVGKEYTVPVTVSDPDGDLSYVELNVYSVDTGGLVARDEKPVSGYEANATLHFTVNRIGPYRIVLAVYDKAGHSDDRTIAIFADDNIPPSVKVLWTKDVNVPGVIYVDFKAHDNYELNVAKVYYRRAGSNEWIFHEAYELSGTEYEVQAGIPVFEPGEYNMMIVVSDVAGNEATAYASARAVDEIAPVITITAPNEVNQGEEFQFRVDVTDNYKIGSVYVKVDGNTIYSNESVNSNHWSETFTYTFTHASQHHIEVVAEDVLHNEVTKEHPVEVHTVDANAPVIELNAWYDENTNYILWEVHVTDPNLADVNVYLNGEYLGSCDVSDGVADCGGGHVVDEAGKYTVKVVAVDEFGNRSEKSVTITITDEPPVLNISAPATVPVGGTATIHVSASDDFGLAHIELNGYGIGVDENISGRAFERDFNVVLSKEGEYAYRVAVTDTAGHRVEKNVTIVATTEGHTYDLVLTAYSGTTARVVVQGKIDGSLVDLYCSDVVVNIEPADSETPMGSYTTHDTIVDNHKACEVVVTGTGKYIVRATWMGVTKGTIVTVFSESVAAPESVWVALVLGLVALGVLGRLI